jgi:hypothetical protein
VEQPEQTIQVVTPDQPHLQEVMWVVEVPAAVAAAQREDKWRRLAAGFAGRETDYE